MICFYNEDVAFPFTGKKRLVGTQIQRLIDMENKKAGNISFIFCSDDFLLDMNKKHLSHDYYTDVITFDYTENRIVSGDIFISIERVKENADKFGVSFVQELSRVMFHGVLHICGYGDKSEDEERIMREKENYYLKTLITE
jgi:rRNA maturation RNase YbeY